MDNMDKRLEKIIKDLPYTEKQTIRNIKSKMFKAYEFVKPILMGLALFWIFFRIKTRVGFEDGANDARFLAQFGINGIVWGADGDCSRHTLNEHVNIESVYELYRILDEFMNSCMKNQ